jgi:hypothetical protein
LIQIKPNSRTVGRNHASSPRGTPGTIKAEDIGHHEYFKYDACDHFPSFID